LTARTLTSAQITENSATMAGQILCLNNYILLVQYSFGNILFHLVELCGKLDPVI
jgi:hypothetical protein